VEAEERARLGLTDLQAGMQISTVNRPWTSLNGPVKVPQKEQCGSTAFSPARTSVRAGYTASYPGDITVREMLTILQQLPRDAEVLAFEAGCEEYCEREVDEVEWQGGQVYLHLGVRRDDRRQR
jgi:hypothetical protein